jgi:hypothetical protein
MTENNVPAAPTATREALLVEAWTLLVPLFAEVGLELPTDVRISVGFGKGKMCSPEIQGQAWKREATEDLRPAVFVSPQVPHIAEALAVLIHQGIHVALDNEGGHGPKIAGDIERRLGRYDHAPLLLPTPVAARTVAASSGGAVAVKLHSGESSERNRHLSFYCAVHPGPVRMSASKASRNALVCTELTDDGICMGQLTRDKP